GEILANSRDAGAKRPGPPAGKSWTPVQNRRVVARGAPGGHRAADNRETVLQRDSRLASALPKGAARPERNSGRCLRQRRATAMSDSPTLDKLVAVSPRFARSISLVRDAQRTDALQGYILTPTGR